MKNLFSCSLLFATAILSAAIPQSITLKSGEVSVRLDGKKRWNMNRIEYQGELLCVDYPHAHYGMVCRPDNWKIGVGSGHDETGFAEQLVSLKIFADGKEVLPQKDITVQGKNIRVEKVSKILTLNVKYIINIENNIIYEFIETVSTEKMKLHHLYFFMHPWSPRFTNLYVKYADGTVKDFSFKSDNSFPNRKFAPFSAWYDSKSGYGAATAFKNVKGTKNMMRFIWDRPQYRKDYLCDYLIASLPAGHVISYEAKTAFFRQQDNSKWTADAENVFKQIKF